MENKISTIEDQLEIISYINGEKRQKIMDSEAKSENATQKDKTKKRTGECYI